MRQILVLSFLIITSLAQAQVEDDHINWSFNKYSFAINDTWKVDLTPIFRLNQDFTNYQNSSIDYMLKRSIGNGFSIGFMGRTWFIPEQKIRQFVWFDLNHKLNIPNAPLGISQRIRLHGALDINDRMDRDFIRYQIGVTGAFPNSIIEPYIGIEPFFRLNKLNYFERFRSEYGFRIKAAKNLKLSVVLWKEDLFDLEEDYTNYIWVTGMQYTFDKPLIKEKPVN